ncbi:hypothetical protein AK812_SmicGene28431 [Symbiodinium microadriaticum]|uniref:Uncharacterized protein n=1 Tax=Symbiodinium microadriaticum TaxID=2951 RepID=A0A1Q9D4B4_SYMMI|nr:hypothetical protein AK812_SmicGene28431 [Symbiodinium microadriaticum]CAE7253535.1 unnamed protein product [Symbiodinium microadriaticum]
MAVPKVVKEVIPKHALNSRVSISALNAVELANRFALLSDKSMSNHEHHELSIDDFYHVMSALYIELKSESSAVSTLMSRDAYDAADDADDEPREVRVDEEVTDPDYGAQADLTGWSGPVSGNGSSEQGSMADPMDRRVRHGALGLDPEDRAGRLEPSGSGQQSVSPIGGSGVEGETHRQTRQSMDDQVTSVAEGQPAGNDESQRALEVPEALSPCTRKVGAADGVSASPDEQSRQQHQAFLESAGRAAASSPLGQASQAESGSRSGRDARLEELLEDVVMSMNFLSSRVQSLEEAKSSEQLVGGRQAFNRP